MNTISYFKHEKREIPLTIPCYNRQKPNPGSGKTKNIRQRSIVDQIQVGPKMLRNKKIMVFKEDGFSLGHQGSLGQDFFQNFNYTIDYANNIIKWAE